MGRTVGPRALATWEQHRDSVLGNRRGCALGRRSDCALGRRSGDAGTALALTVLQACVGVIPGDRTPNADGLRRRTEGASAGDGKGWAAIDGVRALEMRCQNHREVAGLSVDMARQGLLTPAVLRKRSAGRRLWAQRSAVPIAPGVFHGLGYDVDGLSQDCDVELLICGAGKEVGLCSPQSVGAGLGRSTSSRYRKLLELSLDHCGDSGEQVLRPRIEETGRAGVK